MQNCLEKEEKNICEFRSFNALHSCDSTSIFITETLMLHYIIKSHYIILIFIFLNTFHLPDKLPKKNNWKIVWSVKGPPVVIIGQSVIIDIAVWMVIKMERNFSLLITDYCAMYETRISKQRESDSVATRNLPIAHSLPIRMLTRRCFWRH